MMNTVLDWIAYAIAGAVALLSIAGCLLLIADSIRSVRRNGLRMLWRDILPLLLVVGVVMFVIWRFER